MIGVTLLLYPKSDLWGSLSPRWGKATSGVVCGQVSINNPRGRFTPPLEISKEEILGQAKEFPQHVVGKI